MSTASGKNTRRRQGPRPSGLPPALDLRDATKKVRHAMANASSPQIRIVETKHFRDSVADRGLATADPYAIMKRGEVVAAAPHHKSGEWTYEVRGLLDGDLWTVVIAFGTGDEVVLVELRLITVYPEGKEQVR